MLITNQREQRVCTERVYDWLTRGRQAFTVTGGSEDTYACDSGLRSSRNCHSQNGSLRAVLRSTLLFKLTSTRGAILSR